MVKRRSGAKELTTGSALTAKFARQHNKPSLHVDLDYVQDPVAMISDWISDWDIKILNVAGRSESKAPGIYDQVKNIMKEVLKPFGKDI